jgi:nucleoside-diphosphate-sugar epimerase
MIHKPPQKRSLFCRLVALFLSTCLALCESSAYALPPINAASLLPLTIPQQWGTLEESFESHSGKTLLFIQDAHDSLEAQIHIAQLITHFVHGHGVKTVYEEGYEGLVPTDDYFQFIKDPEIKRKVSYFLLDKLRLGGAEYAHINRKKDYKLVGADNLKAYQANLKQYKHAAQNQKIVASNLQLLEKEINNLANQYFSEDFKTWMKLKDRLDRNEIDYFEYLKRMNQDPAQLIKLTPRIFFQELDRIENTYATERLKSKRHEILFQYTKDLKLLQKLNAIQLSAAEYQAVKQKLDHINTRVIAEFIVSETKHSIVLPKKWERKIKYAIRFYELAHQRDRAIESRMEEFLQNKDEKTAILVFGGFHQNGIKEILKGKNISYQIMTPKINQISDRHRNYYKQLMTVGHHNFEIPFLLSRAARSEMLLLRPNARAEIRAIYNAAQAAASKRTAKERRLSEARKKLTAEETRKIAPKKRKFLEEFNAGKNFPFTEEALEGYEGKNWGVTVRRRFAGVDGKPSLFYSLSLLAFIPPNSRARNELLQIQKNFREELPFAKNKFFKTPKRALHFTIKPFGAAGEKPISDEKIAKAKDEISVWLTGKKSFDVWIEGLSIDANSGRIRVEVYSLFDEERRVITLFAPFKALKPSEKKALIKWVEKYKNHPFGSLSVKRLELFHAKDSFGVESFPLSDARYQLPLSSMRRAEARSPDSFRKWKWFRLTHTMRTGMINPMGFGLAIGIMPLVIIVRHAPFIVVPAALQALAGISASLFWIFYYFKFHGSKNEIKFLKLFQIIRYVNIFGVFSWSTVLALNLLQLKTLRFFTIPNLPAASLLFSLFSFFAIGNAVHHFIYKITWDNSFMDNVEAWIMGRRYDFKEPFRGGVGRKIRDRLQALKKRQSQNRAEARVFTLFRDNLGYTEFDEVWKAGLRTSVQTEKGEDDVKVKKVVVPNVDYATLTQQLFQQLLMDFDFSGVHITDSGPRTQEQAISFLRDALHLDSKPLVKLRKEGLIDPHPYVTILGLIFRKGNEALEARPFIENILEAIYRDTDAENKISLSSISQPYRLRTDRAVAAWDLRYAFKGEHAIYKPTPEEKKTVNFTEDLSVKEKIDAALMRIENWARDFETDDPELREKYLVRRLNEIFKRQTHIERSSERSRKLEDLHQRALNLVNQTERAETRRYAKFEILKRIDEVVQIMRSQEIKNGIRDRIRDIQQQRIFNEDGIAFIPRVEGAELLVIGDLHGDLTTFHAILKQFNVLDRLKSGKLYIAFLGDYVDGGYKPVELLMEIMQLKIDYKDHVVIGRGNHEQKETPEGLQRLREAGKKYLRIRGKEMNIFSEEVKSRYDEETYFAFTHLFDELPSLTVTGNRVVLAHAAPPFEPVHSLRQMVGNKGLQHQLRNNYVITKEGKGSRSIVEPMFHDFLTGTGGLIFLAGHFDGYPMGRPLFGNRFDFVISHGGGSPDAPLFGWGEGVDIITPRVVLLPLDQEFTTIPSNALHVILRAEVRTPVAHTGSPRTGTEPRKSRAEVRSIDVVREYPSLRKDLIRLSGVLRWGINPDIYPGRGLGDIQRTIEFSDHLARVISEKEWRQKTVRILNIGPGSGFDAMTVVNQILKKKKNKRIQLDLIELDSEALRNSRINLQNQLSELGFRFSYDSEKQTLHDREGNLIRFIRVEAGREWSFLKDQGSLPYDLIFFHSPTPGRGVMDQTQQTKMPDIIFWNLLKKASEQLSAQGILLFRVLNLKSSSYRGHLENYETKMRSAGKEASYEKSDGYLLVKPGKTFKEEKLTDAPQDPVELKPRLGHSLRNYATFQDKERFRAELADRLSGLAEVPDFFTGDGYSFDVLAENDLPIQPIGSSKVITVQIRVSMEKERPVEIWLYGAQDFPVIQSAIETATKATQWIFTPKSENYQTYRSETRILSTGSRRTGIETENKVKKTKVEDEEATRRAEVRTDFVQRLILDTLDRVVSKAYLAGDFEIQLTPEVLGLRSSMSLLSLERIVFAFNQSHPQYKLAPIRTELPRSYFIYPRPELRSVRESEPVKPEMAITGASGNIGSALLRLAARHGERVTAIVRDEKAMDRYPSRFGEALPDSEYPVMSLLDTESLRKIVREHRVLYHMAAFLGAEAFSEKHAESITVNVFSSMKFIWLAQEENPTIRYVFASTGHYLKNNSEAKTWVRQASEFLKAHKDEILSESDPEKLNLISTQLLQAVPIPPGLSLYELGKFLVEEELTVLPNFVAPRIVFVYGPGMLSKTATVGRLIEARLRGESPKLGRISRQFIFLNDVAEILWKLGTMEKIEDPFPSLTDGTVLYGAELWKILERLMPDSPSTVDLQGEEVLRGVPQSPDAARALLGRPFKDFEEGVKEQIEWQRNLKRSEARMDDAVIKKEGKLLMKKFMPSDRSEVRTANSEMVITEEEAMAAFRKLNDYRKLVGMERDGAVAYSSILAILERLFPPELSGFAGLEIGTTGNALSMLRFLQSRGVDMQGVGYEAPHNVPGVTRGAAQNFLDLHPNAFDFIYAYRTVNPSQSVNDYELHSLYRKMHAALKPGGWVVLLNDPWDDEPTPSALSEMGYEIYPRPTFLGSISRHVLLLRKPLKDPRAESRMDLERIKRPEETIKAKSRTIVDTDLKAIEPRIGELGVKKLALIHSAGSQRTGTVGVKSNGDGKEKPISLARAIRAEARDERKNKIWVDVDKEASIWKDDSLRLRWINGNRFENGIPLRIKDGGLVKDVLVKKDVPAVIELATHKKIILRLEQLYLREAKVEVVAARKHFATKEEFARNFALPPSLEMKAYHGEKTVREIIDHEWPAARVTIASLLRLRKWMDESGAETRPLLIWQNMRLGGLYPYFTETLKAKLGVVEITFDQLEQYNKEGRLPEYLKAARFILIKYKIDSALYGARQSSSQHQNFLTHLARFSKSVLSPIVMIDSSLQMRSKAQTRISNHLFLGDNLAEWTDIARSPIYVRSSSRDEFKNNLGRESFLNLVNPTANAYTSWMDGSIFMDLSVDVSSTTFPEDRYVFIGDEIREVSKLAREVYRDATDQLFKARAKAFLRSEVREQKREIDFSILENFQKGVIFSIDAETLSRLSRQEWKELLFLKNQNKKQLTIFIPDGDKAISNPRVLELLWHGNVFFGSEIEHLPDAMMIHFSSRHARIHPRHLLSQEVTKRIDQDAYFDTYSGAFGTALLYALHEGHLEGLGFVNGYRYDPYRLYAQKVLDQIFKNYVVISSAA